MSIRLRIFRMLYAFGLTYVIARYVFSHDVFGSLNDSILFWIEETAIVVFEKILLICAAIYAFIWFGTYSRLSWERHKIATVFHGKPFLDTIEMAGCRELQEKEDAKNAQEEAERKKQEMEDWNRNTNNKY